MLPSSRTAGLRQVLAKYRDSFTVTERTQIDEAIRLLDQYEFETSNQRDGLELLLRIAEVFATLSQVCSSL